MLIGRYKSAESGHERRVGEEIRRKDLLHDEDCDSSLFGHPGREQALHFTSYDFNYLH